MKKTCTKCGEEKELDFFHKEAGCKYGVKSQCKECRNEIKKKHYLENQEYYVEYARKRRKTKEHKQVREKRRKKRSKEDPLFKLTCAIRRNISNHITRNGYSKKSKTVKILGCSYEEFKKHLESKFQKGMTWDNYGRNGWHIDHIYPVSRAKDEQHLIELNHYTNLQPLWEKDNIAKGNKIL